MLCRLLLVSSLLAGLAFSDDSTLYDHYRLPTAVRPEHYRLKLITHLNDAKGFEFAGDVEITVIVNEDTGNVTLHSKNLMTDHKQIVIKTLPDGQIDPEQCVKEVILNAKHDYYSMVLCKPFVKGGRYLLTIPFKADLNKNLDGYYRSSYIDKVANQTRWLSVTQFEAVSARKAFPCFDEPEMKAKFSIVLGHHKNFQAISNMPLKSTKEIDGEPDFVWDEFEESVPMSTYLVAYSVNDFFFDEVTVGMQSNVKFRTWARKDAKSQVEYAGQVGPRVLRFYEDQFDIKFPLPKIDQMAVPDFSAGAMENWGLVTYRETALLYSKNNSDARNKHRVASVISHELAHQWFGNLVTMKWWTDLWLNEGFATYIASLGVDYLHPEWDSLNEESVDNTLQIFKDDALVSSHPVSVNIGHASGISQIFDSISYNKGSCVIRMMHLFLGDDAFRSGISGYLKKFAYSNAEQDNLWSSLTQSAHKLRTIPEEYNMKRIMDSWTLQTGYPVITVNRNYDDGSAEIEQMRYLMDTKVARNADENCWWVPLSYTAQDEHTFNQTQPRTWLECDGKNPIAKKIENLASPDKWVIFNNQLAGLYKVKYDEKNWNMLIQTLTSPEFEEIHVMNRAQLIDDALDFAWTGELDYDFALRILEYMEQEKDYLPWKSALDSLKRIHRMIRYTPQYEHFKIYIQKVLTPIYHTLGGINETTTNSERIDTDKHKAMIAGWACLFQVGDCISKSLEYFQEWKSTPNPDEVNPIPLNFRSVIYCTVVRKKDSKDWDFIYERFEKSNSAAEKQRILSALGCSGEVWVLQRYLERAFSDASAIRKQDAYTVFNAVARGEIGFHLARDYLIDNIAKLHKFFEPESNKLSRLITPIASQMNTEKEYNFMMEFTEKNKAIFEKASESIKRALETIRINTQWKEQKFEQMSKRLQKFI